MKKRPKEALRRELEYIIMPFEVAKRRAVGINGWLRAVRRAQDLSAKDVAERLWVKKREIMRIEVAEMNGTVNLLKMRCVAAVMGCDLVYAFVPKETTFEEIAERDRKQMNSAKDRRRAEKKADETVTADSVMQKLALELEKEFRKLGIEWVRR
jgi:hypothetical protein